jgi:hypothetical protein
MFIRTIFFATLCFWGSILAFLPVVSIMISENAYSNSSVNGFIKSNREVLLSIGTLLLISLLAVVQVYIGNRSSEARERANRAIQAELKVAEFRQQWINELRQELAECYLLAFEDKDTRNTAAFGAVWTKIRIRLNLDEPKAQALYRSMFRISDYQETLEPFKKGEALSDFMNASHDFLRNEWKRLKSDIKNSESYTEPTP